MNPLAVNPAVAVLRGLIRAYQWTVAPVLGVNCRFAPSCSEYACEAIGRHGALAGVFLALRRLLRCQPWGGSGYDPVPDESPLHALAVRRASIRPAYLKSRAPLRLAARWASIRPAYLKSRAPLRLAARCACAFHRSAKEPRR